MSRSLYTQKLEIRAERRMARPYGTRREEGARLSGRSPAGKNVPVHSVDSSCLPPIRMQRPACGSIHPIRARDIRDLMELIGCASFYGLRAIRLRHECSLRRSGLVFAEYVIPGEIHLYSMPASPWRLPFLLADSDLAAFARHGAHCSVDTGLHRTIVEWLDDSLRDFCLVEVLAHELGHHLLQYNAGKRAAPIRRRFDHERFADLHGRRAYETLQRSREGGR